MLIPPSAGIALPAVTSLEDCANWAKTVEPYIPQLYTLPNQILASITDLQALKHLYISTNPLISGFAFSLALFPVFLVISEYNRNYSQVDRVWSILPTLYNAHYALWARLSGLPTQRLDLVLAFGVAWSTRLTFNYWRRGGYQVGSEDYRWELIKKYIGHAGFFVLNILFISSVQSVCSARTRLYTNMVADSSVGPSIRSHVPNLHPAPRLASPACRWRSRLLLRRHPLRLGDFRVLCRWPAMVVPQSQGAIRRDC